MNPHDPAAPTAPDSDAGPATPRVSIVVTLARHRGLALDSFRSWAESDGFAREQIELVVVSNGKEPALEQRVQSFLAPGDQLLRLATRNEMELYAHGARRARGEWLLFTEPHCIAEPACLKTLVETIQLKGLEGGCVRTLPSAEKGWIQRVEARMYLDDAADWTREGDWRKFTKRGFLLRRAAYEAVGGLEFQYGYFAEMAIAARLHATGYRLGFVPDARIMHYNSSGLEELLAYVRDYRRQERVYHLDHPHVLEGPARPVVDVAATRDERLRDVMARSLRRTLRDTLRWRTLSSGKRARAAWAMARLSVAETLRLRWAAPVARWKAQLGCWTTWLRLHQPRMAEEARYRCFMELWQRVGDCATLEPIRGRSQNAPSAMIIRGDEPCLPVALAAPAAFGFHEVEEHGGRAFRWSEPSAGLAVDIERSAVEVTFDVGQIRPVSRSEVRLFWNGKPQKLNTADAAGGRLVFGVRERDFAAQGPQLMSWLCAPVSGKESRDRRRLGLPVFAIRFGRPERP